MREKKYTEPNKRMILSWLVLIFMGILLLVRAHYGMDTTDETFYLSTAKRFSDGDYLLKHDWNTGQLFGFLLLPVYRGYLFLHGSNEGIILCSRMLFVFLEVFTAGFLCAVLIHYTGKWGAALTASLCMLVYARGNIINLSYYSVGMLSFVLAILWWAEAQGRSRKRLLLVFSGISFAVSVLCMPYMVLLFGCLLALGLYFQIRHQAEKRDQIVWFTAGIALAAAVFLAYYGRFIPWKELPEYLPMLFQDPTLEEEGAFTQIRDVFLYFTGIFMKYTWPIYAGTFLASIVGGREWILKASQKKYLEWILLAEFVLQSVYVRTFFEGGVITTFFLLALQMQLLYPEHRERKMEKIFLYPGLCFGIVWILGSNVGERVINMGFLIMDVWAVLFLWNHVSGGSRLLQAGRKLPAYVLLSVLAIIRFLDIYRDGEITGLTEKITSGVMAGIYTEPQRAEIYEEMVSYIHENTDKEDTLLVLGINPWVYMETEARCGAYSTWEMSGDNALEALYYETFPEKVPNVILLPSEKLDVYKCWRFSSHGSGLHEGERLKLSGIYRELVETQRYEELRQDAMTLYRK